LIGILNSWFTGSMMFATRELGHRCSGKPWDAEWDLVWCPSEATMP